MEQVIFINKGVGNKCQTIMLDSSAIGTSGSRCGRGGKEAYITRIDDEVGEDKVTFIKMDVEGAELSALQGACKTIKANKPHLAICVYHKHSDLYDIPKYLLELVPEYRFVVRHYTSCMWETVLYASVDGFQI